MMQKRLGLLVRAVFPAALGVVALGFQSSAHAAQVVEKVADLSFANVDGVGVGGYYPLDRFTQAGTNLWFTTERGGTYDEGTISRFDLGTGEIVQVASMDKTVQNNIGGRPEGTLLIVGDSGYFTTKNGGLGNRGTIARIDLATGAITALHHFPESGSPDGETPRGGLTLIGDTLFCTTSGGGTNNMGTILGFSLASNAVSFVHHFDGASTGRQPYDGFARVGDAYYFTTFTGGTNSGTGVGNGAGTLGRMTFDGEGTPVIEKVWDLPVGHTQFPASTPTLVGTNALYFMTVGPNTAPGSIVRYDLASGTGSVAFTFRTNAPEPVLHGRQPGYNGMVEWQGDLYFTTRQGGTNNTGVVAKFNIASNTVTKLADLNGVGIDALGSGSSSFNAGTIVEVTNRFYAYFPITRGGAFTGVTGGAGTIVRVALPAAPIRLALTQAEAGLALSWTGGYAPFTVQATGDVTGGWTNRVETVSGRSAAFSEPTANTFYRVIGSE
jgi:uncharacterized repeat protein (TIGR03803 family)